MNTPRTAAATLTEPYLVRELPFEVVRADMEKLETELATVAAERDALLRGEYICKKCGIRKDGEGEKGDF